MSTQSWKIIIRYGSRDWTLTLATLPPETVEAFVVRFLRTSGEVFDPARLSIYVGDAIDAKAMTLVALGALRPGGEISIVVTDLPPAPAQSPPVQAPAATKFEMPPPAAARAPARAPRDEEGVDFELALEESGPASGAGKDVFEPTNFDVPALDDESGSETVALDDQEAPSVARPRARARMDEDMDEDEEDVPRKSRGAVRAKRKATFPAKTAAPPKRNVLVQYFSRMNPERTYELDVTLSREQIEAAVQAGVKQARSSVELRSRVLPIEIEPILPGCTCYPPRDAVPVAGETATVKFRVVAHVRGEVGGARIVLRQGKHILGEIPLEIRVADTLIVRVSAAGALFLPFVTTAMKQYKLDLESQMADGFGLYLTILNGAVNTLRPEGLALILLGLTVVAYFFTRPQKANLEWNLATKTGSGRSFWARLSEAAAGGGRAGGKLSVFWGVTGFAAGCVVTAAIGLLSSWARAFSVASLLVPALGFGAAALGFLYGLGLGFYEEWSED